MARSIMRLLLVATIFLSWTAGAEGRIFDDYGQEVDEVVTDPTATGTDGTDGSGVPIVEGAVGSAHDDDDSGGNSNGILSGGSGGELATGTDGSDGTIVVDGAVGSAHDDDGVDSGPSNGILSGGGDGVESTVSEGTVIVDGAVGSAHDDDGLDPRPSNTILGSDDDDLVGDDHTTSGSQGEVGSTPQFSGQANFELKKIKFQLGNSTIDGALAEQLCSVPWAVLSNCMKFDCPYYAYVCPSFGQVATSIDSCSAVTEGFCSETSNDSCCLDACLSEFVGLTTCIHGKVAPEEVMEVCDGPMDCDVLYGNSTNATDTSEEVDPDAPLISIEEGDGVSVFDSFQFGPYGAEEMQDICPEQWKSFVACVSTQCPYDFVDVCEGSSGGNPVGVLKAGLLDPTCEDLEHDICDFAGGEECCLQSCLVETQQMTACIHKVRSIAIDLTTCKEISACSALSFPSTTSKTRTVHDDKSKGSKSEQTDSMNTDELVGMAMSGANPKALPLFGLIAIAVDLLA